MNALLPGLGEKLIDFIMQPCGFQGFPFIFIQPDAIAIITAIDMIIIFCTCMRARKSIPFLLKTTANPHFTRDKMFRRYV